MSDSSGIREQSIPGEWAALLLIIVIGAAFAFLVLWFTMRRHEQTVLDRAGPRSEPYARLIGDADEPGLFPDTTADAVTIADGDSADVVDAAEIAEAAEVAEVAGAPGVAGVEAVDSASA